MGGRGGEGDRTGKEGRTLTDGVSMIVLKCVCACRYGYKCGCL